MQVRKVSIGTDYKDNAMHYICGQSVLNSTHTIHLIKVISDGVQIWIENGKDELLLWKQFNTAVPMSLEFNINF